MEQCLKKCEKINRATDQKRISSLYIAFKNEYSGDTAEFPANASSPASFSNASCCCYYDAAAEAGRRRLRSLDLKAVDNGRFGRKVSSSAGVSFRDEATSSLENICGDSREVMEMKKPKLAPPANLQKLSPVSAAKTPSAAELEEFFTEAEEYVQKRFTEKYNYDIVKDAPILGGRYQWVRTHI